MADEPYQNLLDEALEAWADVRKGVVEEAESIPDAHWSFRPHAASRSVEELVHHILESGEMAVGELTRPDGDFTRQSYPEHLREHAGRLPSAAPPAELKALLRETFTAGAARYRSAGELRMLQHIRRFDGLEGTRLAWLNHSIAHEMYHRGQLALYVRLTGGVPALTRAIEGS
jgi:uncharacterized damage-inducible protein DinB